MTCHNATMTSQTSHFDFEPPSWIPSAQSYSWQWQCCKIYEFVLRNILNQNEHKKVKDYLLRTNLREKTEKKTEKRQKIATEIHSWVDGCYGNVNHHRHVIDTEKFSLINFRKSHEIWWLFVQPFKSQRGHNVPPPPRLNRVKSLSVKKRPGNLSRYIHFPL